jgi:hypothetical protein
MQPDSTSSRVVAKHFYSAAYVLSSLSVTTTTSGGSMELDQRLGLRCWKMKGQTSYCSETRMPDKMLANDCFHPVEAMQNMP